MKHLPQEEIERRLAVAEEKYDEERAERSLLDRLQVERQKLEDRISTPPPSLLDRIKSIASSSSYEIPLPPPSDLHFVKTKFLKRIKEFDSVVDAVRDRFDPVFARLNESAKREYLGIESGIPEEYHAGLWIWWDRLQDIGNDLETIGRGFKEGDWRNFMGALKRLKKVDTSLPLLELCTKLTEMKITLP
jgi:hypothetical protein